MPGRTRRGRPSRWSTNEVLLAITCGIIGGLLLLIVVGSLQTGATATEVLAAAICPGSMAALPFVLLIRSRIKSARPHRRSAMAHVGNSPRAGLIEIEITPSDRLPRCCVRCGTHTRRTSRLWFPGAHTEARRYDWSRVHPLLFIFLAWKFAGHLLLTKLYEMIERRLDRRSDQSRGLRFKIPHCRGCAANHPILQRHLDFHGRKMIIHAHPDFSRHVHELRIR